MFTGIVQETGTVESLDGSRLSVRSPLLKGRELGASVAVSGVCLTVTDLDGDLGWMDLAAETVDRTTLGAKRPGDPVNLELPLKAGDELGGHIVQGHVDGRGTVLEGPPDLLVRLAPELLTYVVEKGSVTIDGCSLTVTTVDAGSFGVALIPHTCDVTTLGALRPGDDCNIEIDVIARYVEKMMRSVRA